MKDSIPDFGSIFIMLSLYYWFVDFIYYGLIPFNSYVYYKYLPLGGLFINFKRSAQC